MNKVLTIVVPTFNMEKYLNKCLSSCVIDDPNLMSKLEIIVVNDGSVDNSSTIAHSYEANYPGTFIVVDKENGNYGSCVNVGLKHATGKYLRILDADDWFDTDALINFLKALENIDTDLVFTAMNTHSETGVVYESSSNIFEEGVVYEINKLKCNFEDLCVHMHTMTFKKSVLDECQLRLSEGVSYTDTEYCYFPLPYCKTVVFYPICLYQYLYGREGQTMSPSALKKSVNSMAVVAKKIAENYSVKPASNNIVSIIQFELASRILSMLYYFGIVVLPKSQTTDSLIKSVDECVRRNSELNTFVKHLKQDYLPYAVVWRYSRLHYNSNFIKLYIRTLALTYQFYHSKIKRG